MRSLDAHKSERRSGRFTDSRSISGPIWRLNLLKGLYECDCCTRVGGAFGEVAFSKYIFTNALLAHAGRESVQTEFTPLQSNTMCNPNSAAKNQIDLELQRYFESIPHLVLDASFMRAPTSRKANIRFRILEFLNGHCITLSSFATYM
jgi:hypothetical protein